ncbi:hypothetical protein BT69DRAFT_1293033 [Atractiella rhizophila]|nr:hypothetical protein BT69DRAFT_1293033 [Atractiella rhizophila]
MDTVHCGGHAGNRPQVQTAIRLCPRRRGPVAPREERCKEARNALGWHEEQHLAKPKFNEAKRKMCVGRSRLQGARPFRSELVTGDRRGTAKAGLGDVGGQVKREGKGSPNPWSHLHPLLLRSDAEFYSAFFRRAQKLLEEQRMMDDESSTEARREACSIERSRSRVTGKRDRASGEGKSGRWKGRAVLRRAAGGEG